MFHHIKAETTTGTQAGVCGSFTTPPFFPSDQWEGSTTLVSKQRIFYHVEHLRHAFCNTRKCVIGKENSYWEVAERGDGRRQIRKYQKKYSRKKKSLQIWVERVKRGRKHVWCCYHESVVTKIRGETRVAFEESQTFRKKTCAHWLGLLHLVNIYCKRGKEISPFSSYSRSTVNRRQLQVGCVSFPLSCTTAANEEKQGSNQRTLVPWLVAPDPAGDSACSQDRKSGLSKEE